jgi:hypothetical protein
MGRLALGLVLTAGAGNGQTVGHSSAEIIRFLNNPISRPDLLDKNGARIPQVDRAAAGSLVALGSSAIPDLEAAFGLIEQQGPPGALNSRWLFVAYARILGSAAYQRLRAMSEYPGLRPLYGDLDESLAVALDLTSYVSGTRIAGTALCCQFQEPRHALDQFILAWFQGNRLQMEESLGPRARPALKSLLAQRPWLELRRGMLHGAPVSRLAIGYRFDGSDDWSKPEETLDQGLQDRRRSVDLGNLPANPDVLTRFVDVNGGGCGSRAIRFARVARAPGGLRSMYVIDDTDLEGMLRLITDCTVKGPAPRNLPESPR